MDEAEVKRRLKMAFWDTNHTPEELYAVLTSGQPMRFMTKERIYQRLLETFSWYKLMRIVPKNQWEDLLDEKIIQKLRSQELKTRYEYVGRVLRTTTFIGHKNSLFVQTKP
jgi:hypothetical protein